MARKPSWAPSSAQGHLAQGLPGQRLRGIHRARGQTLGLPRGDLSLIRVPSIAMKVKLPTSRLYGSLLFFKSRAGAFQQKGRLMAKADPGFKESRVDLEKSSRV